MATDALISQTLSPLINGVSEQPTQRRLPSQAERQVNMLSDVAAGVKRRPPMEHVAIMSGSLAGAIPSGGYYFHLIDRGPTQRFLCVIEDGDINVFDLGTGLEVTVNDGAGGSPGSYTYLDITPSSTVTAQNSFEAVTVADYTFILNKRKTAAMSGSTSTGRAHANEFILFIQSFSGAGASSVQKLSFDGSTATTGGASNHTNDMMDSLCNNLTGGPNPNATTGTGGGSINDWKFTRVGSNLLYGYQFQGANDTVTYSDFYGDTLSTFAATSATGDPPQVSRFSDLPAQGVDGFKIKVTGDAGNRDDEFWVVWDSGDKVWKETVAPGLDDNFSAVTMPHALVYDSGTGQFTFQPITWTARLVGDETSAPQPSFIGKTINDIVVHKNRLMLVSDENVIASEAGEFFNFWPTSVAVVVDSDPWDVAGTGNQVAIWDFAVPFVGGLTLFSATGALFSELVGSRDESLTIKNARIEERGAWAFSKVRPASAGDALYFVLDRTAQSSIFQYAADGNGTFSVDEITNHVPSFVPANISQIKAGRAENILIGLTNDEDNAIYVYRYHFLSTEQVMASWSKWSIDTAASILFADWSGSVLYLVISRQDGLFIEKMDFGKVEEDATLGHRVYLDSLFSTTGLFTGAPTNKTLFTIPYDQFTNGGTFMVIKNGSWGATRGEAITPVTNTTDLVLSVDGDYSAFPVYIGRVYDSEYELSEPVLKENSTISKKPARLSGRLQVQTGTVSFFDSAAFDVEIKSWEDSDTNTYSYEGDNSPQELEDGEFDFHVGSDARNVRVIFASVDHLPCGFSSAEWAGRFTQQTTQV